MKMRFSMIMGGHETFHEKIENVLKENPTVHMDLIKAFGHAVMMAFRLNEKDNISIEGFRMEKMVEEEKENARNEENEYKKVDS